MREKTQTIWCERCQRRLNPAKAVWLELSNTNGQYYEDIPKGHVSQGAFPFGLACAEAQLLEIGPIE